MIGGGYKWEVEKDEEVSDQRKTRRRKEGGRRREMRRRMSIGRKTLRKLKLWEF